MVGTKAGGKKAAETNKLRHGEGFYARIGAMGGRNGYTGGFASATPEFRRACGRKGGHISRRAGGYGRLWEQCKNKAIGMYHEGLSYKEIADAVGMSYGALRQRLRKEVL